MRTTLRISDELLKEAKRIAAESDRTVGEVIEDALRESFVRRKAPTSPGKVKLPTFRGHGLQPGVTWDDLNSYGRMLDLMDDLDSDRRDSADTGR